jgi:hypothetical protein
MSTNSQKIAYNKESAEKYGWTPQDFGCTEHNEELLFAIIQFQRDNGLLTDGLAGSSTHRRLITNRESEEEHTEPNGVLREYIVCNGQKQPIHWGRVRVWNEDGGLKAVNYRKHSGNRDVKMFVTHWDATLNSKACAKILDQRKLSVHFLIDNDGTIYQMADTNDVCFHAGNHNGVSIGVEITNAYYLKWQDWYVRKGFGERPVVKGVKCHNSTLEDHLGFYDVQLEALTALYRAVSDAHNIPLIAPNVRDTVDPDVQSKAFRGFCSHYHITDRKIDCAGLDIEAICKKAITLS